jgi:murein L,D-transpeptidase YcbB/YkuD
MFPNQYAIYLHDTPTRRSFSRSQRTLSHGCVWVEKPVELADYVLAAQGGWNEKKIRQAMLTAHSASAGGRVDGQRVSLEQPLPVYIVYFTAFVRDGAVNFRRDTYGKDREAIARLGKVRPTDSGLREKLQKLVGE